jgi:nucleolar complex protein 2
MQSVRKWLLTGAHSKVPTQSKKYATAQRIVKSFYSSLHSLLSSLSSTSNTGLLQLAITESGRLIPYLVGNRKVSKDHVRYLLNYWATSPDDSVKLSAFLSLRTIATAGDASLYELVVKGTYLAIGQVAKNTTAFTLPSITLMKNSASSLFVTNNPAISSQAYQLAFSYIRQLAVTLRNSMKATPKSGTTAAGGNKGKPGSGQEPYRQVYSWQFIHSIDFWSLVLATACDTEKETEQGRESELRPLIYPLVQLTLGVVR